jgi:hypothetical protein
MQGADSHGQNSVVSASGSSTKVSMGHRDCRIGHFTDSRERVDHCRGNLF